MPLHQTIYHGNRRLKQTEVIGSGLQGGMDSNRDVVEHNTSQLAPLNGNGIAHQQQVVSSIKKGNTKL